VTRRDGKVFEIIRDVKDCDEEETGCEEDYDSDGYTVEGFDDSVDDTDDDEEDEDDDDDYDDDDDDEDEY
jgi:casein kinase II subunit beta